MRFYAYVVFLWMFNMHIYIVIAVFMTRGYRAMLGNPQPTSGAVHENYEVIQFVL